jgi:hypothetical protein
VREGGALDDEIVLLRFPLRKVHKYFVIVTLAGSRFFWMSRLRMGNVPCLFDIAKNQTSSSQVFESRSHTALSSVMCVTRGAPKQFS